MMKIKVTKTDKIEPPPKPKIVKTNPNQIVRISFLLKNEFLKISIF